MHIFFYKIEVEFNKRLPVIKVKKYKQSGNCTFIHQFLSSSKKNIFETKIVENVMIKISNVLAEKHRLSITFSDN